MSSEFRVGMHEGRNSSRVLKPPGGGHSQIFGGPEEEAPRKTHAPTEISSCFGTSPAAKTEEKVDSQEKEVKENENTTNGNSVAAENGTNGSTPEKKVEEKKNEINEKKTESASERKRVPPGGFSSGGFW
ncbi:uncharacterized protein [Atheta coriaria]|uniref:uncharacterized protein n=1 Tax=Dalotia coriaria TaxID=877792 RepID=UPI0031F3C71A